MKKLLTTMFMVSMVWIANAAPFYVRVNGTDHEATATGVEDFQGRTQYLAACVHCEVNDIVLCHDGGNEATWHIAALDPYGEHQKFSCNATELKCLVAGDYDFYIKMKYEDDMWYIGEGTCSGPGPGPTPTPASSVPGQCTDVMLQAFYFDSFEVDSLHPGTMQLGATNWKALLRQAGEIGAYFDLVWLPPSSYAAGTGYHPRQLSNQSSDWGSRANLEKLISALHNSDTRVVADIVINHVEAMTSWCDLAPLNFGEYGSFTPDGSYICSNDELNNPAFRADSLAGDCWGTATGAADDGEPWDGARDWAHNSEHVRQMMRAYCQWMINEMHYDGFRYDKGDGFHQSHMDDYNKVAKPYIAFMENWSGNDQIIQAIQNANHNMMALDFQTKYSAFDGIAGWNFSACKGSGLLGRGYSKYAVTFVDSHDWFLRNNGQEFGGNGNSLQPHMKYRLLCANAFMLSMPGVPCVFYPHWVTYKDEIKAMINARHMAGVHSESPVTNETATATGYQATIQGKKGYLILCLGDKSNQSFNGYTRVAYGASTQQGHNEGYAIWVQTNAPTAPGLIVTPDATFTDSIQGITVHLEAVGGSSSTRTIYYTTDGNDPTTASASIAGEGTLHFTRTTTLKVIAACDTAISAVQTYTYTYREPLRRGIQLRFNKPAEWVKAYVYAWIPGVDANGAATSTNLFGAFPGQRIYPAQDGWYTFEFDASLDSVNFCINSGVDCGGLAVRSNDLVADYDVCYGWSDGSADQDHMEVLLDCEEELHPDFALSISPESGIFRDAAIGTDVTLTAIGAPNSIIYYTTDGTDPTTASLSAQGETTLHINQTTTIKAFAYKDKSNITPIQSATYTYRAPQSGPIQVRYRKPDDWKELYLYAFTRVKVGSKYQDTPYSLDGSTPKWPGMRWTTIDTDGWHNYTFPNELRSIYIIFNAGLNKPQSQDICVEENSCYLWNDDCHQAVIDNDCDGLAEGIMPIMLSSDHVQKWLNNGKLYIRVENTIYDTMGHRVQ